MYAYNTSSVGSQYQARVDPWDAKVAGEIQRERQQRRAPNRQRETGSDSLGDVEGQPYFLSSSLPDTTADKCKRTSMEPQPPRPSYYSTIMSADCTLLCPCAVLFVSVDEYWELLSSLQSYSQRRVTQTEALHLVQQNNYNVDDSITQMRLLAGFPDASTEADDSDHVALTDPACTVCGDGGDVFLCDAAGCRRVYHAECLQLDGRAGQVRVSGSLLLSMSSTCGRSVPIVPVVS